MKHGCEARCCVTAPTTHTPEYGPLSVEVYQHQVVPGGQGILGKFLSWVAIVVLPREDIIPVVLITFRVDDMRFCHTTVDGGITTRDKEGSRVECQECVQ